MFIDEWDMQQINNDRITLNRQKKIHLQYIWTFKWKDRCAHLAQLFRVLMQLFQDGQSLLLGAVLQNPLDYSAAIRVRGQHKDLQEYNNTMFMHKYYTRAAALWLH